LVRSVVPAVLLCTRTSSVIETAATSQRIATV
jgi:hypothetical protein